MNDELRKHALEFMRQRVMCHLATTDGAQPWIRVMQTAQVDDDFTIWFATYSGSRKVRQIVANPRVALSYWADGTDLRILGRAERIEDSATLAEMWRDEWQKFFPRGKDDPGYGVIKVRPEMVEYRDLERTKWEAKQIL